MAKKRVHELAKELGLENKDLIAHLEKLGIMVKSHASTLEDHEIERVKEDLQTKSPRQIVEERIKTTVIRRRAVRTPLDEASTEEAPEEKDEKPRVEKETPLAKVQKEPLNNQPEVALPVSAAVAGEKIPEPDQQTEKPATAEIPVEAEPVTEVPAVLPVSSVIPGKPKPPPIIIPVKPPMMSRHRIGKPEEKRDVVAKPVVSRPGEKMIVPPADKTIKREFEKPKKKGKGPVEVFIEEEKEVPRRKLVEKKVDKKIRKDDDDRDLSFGRGREDRKSAPVRMKKTEITVPKAIKRRIRVGESITTGELAKRMGVKAGDVINKLMGMGVMATINQSIDFDIVSLLAAEFSFQVEKAELEFEDTLLRPEVAEENLKPRAPIVTIMGHVDHGKTSLLDAIRQTNVIDGEAGEIGRAHV